MTMSKFSRSWLKGGSAVVIFSCGRIVCNVVNGFKIKHNTHTDREYYENMKKKYLETHDKRILVRKY